MKSNKIIIGILSLSLVATLGVLAWLIVDGEGNLSSENRAGENKINSFQECVEAGNSVLESFPRQCRTEDGRTFVEEIDEEPNQQEQNNEENNRYTSSKGVEVIVDEPNRNETVSSPLRVAGKVPGSWAFEADFPIVFVDENGDTVAQGTATLQGDWMTEELVEFEAELTYENTESASGKVVLQKSNPSGLTENEDEVEIPIKY